MSDSAPIAVTGAAGFLGTAILDAAAEAGVPVRAILRRGSSLPGETRAGVEVADCGLEQAAALTEALRGCRALVHAAASMTADPNDPTATVLEAARAAGVPLVLVSSFSVYASEGVAAGSLVDESRPRFDDAGETGRDAYAALKLGQERLAEAAAEAGLPVVALRPGVIVGPGRGWSARLGIRKGPLAVLVGGDAAVPIVHVADCGRACVRAALLKTEPGFRAYNLAGDNAPTQAAWLRSIRGETGLLLVVPLPRGVVRGLGRALFAVLGNRLPSILRPAAFEARFKPLRHSNDKAKAAGLL